MRQNPEQQRLEEAWNGVRPWYKWGPYLSERQWGTVREDYSPPGSAWDSFPHDHARSRAYRWGEDGIAGISDDLQRLCFAVALWNGRDPILKERLFGLTGSEGNHGEDVKEHYYYLDATPTHSYLKMLYKYPQRAFPYAQLVEENRRRGKGEPEFELIDTGAFDDDRYFDVFIEYAKADVEDILIQVTVHNRGPEEQVIHVIPQAWFRNTWSWSAGAVKPEAALVDGVVELRHRRCGTYRLWCEREATPLFCDNETNAARLFGSETSPVHPKDALHEYIVNGRPDVVNPHQRGTKVGLHHVITIPAGGQQRIRLRLSGPVHAAPFMGFDQILGQRRAEADDFFGQIQSGITDPDARMVQRQALAGMIWSKQFFKLDIPQWLNGDPAQPPPPEQRKRGRNAEWMHLNNADVISMPDKWEYPWYAAWDLAFHCVPLAMIDAEFAKNQLILLTREWYMHPNGQLPAYEWAFGDVNPPVHAWAAWKVYQMDRDRTGRPDLAFLERVFHKLLLNFTWWVNRKDREGRNIFQGGFLGLDNIGVFDRSVELPTGGHINQCDGTSWMAMYSLNLMRIALELSAQNPVYQDLATKFFEHFLYIAAAMTNVGGMGVGLWDEADEFFYDVLCPPVGDPLPLRVRSMVGLIPLFAVEVLEAELLERVPEFTRRLEWFLRYRPDLASLVSRWQEPGRGETRLLSLLRGHRMKCLLRRMLDPNEFLSDFGVRALSRHHLDRPFVLEHAGNRFSVGYTPGESDTSLFGGNSNWRGPIWMPVNYLLIDSIRQFHRYYGDEFKVECPTSSGAYATLGQVADEMSRRLTRIFLKDASGHRPVFNGHPQLQQDPHFRDHVLFYEYFHGDTGRGVGASHQTGWTGLVADLLAAPKVANSVASPVDTAEPRPVAMSHEPS